MSPRPPDDSPPPDSTEPTTVRGADPRQVTRPSPEALAASRREPTDPTLLSPPPPLPMSFDTRAAEHGEGAWPRILLIEDDAEMRETLQMTFEEHGYVVRTAEDGLDGLIRLCQMCPDVDVIVLDIMMPILNGLQFLRVFNESPARDVPVLCISGNPRPPPEELPEGFVFLRKGDMGDPDELVATVRRSIDQGRERRRSLPPRRRA